MVTRKRKAPKTAWAKGKSGNPTGRPKLHPDLRARIVAEVPKALKRVVEVLSDATAEHKDVIAAAKLIFEWGIPKPAPETPKETGDRLKDFIALVQAVGQSRTEDDDDEA